MSVAFSCRTPPPWLAPLEDARRTAPAHAIRVSGVIAQFEVTARPSSVVADGGGEMADTNTASPGGSHNPWKLTTVSLASVIAVVLIGGVVKASFDKSDEAPLTTEASAPEVAKVAPVNQAAAKPAPVQAAAQPAPVRVASQPPPVPQAPPRPTESDIAACNQYAATQRTETGDIVRDGVVGGALGAAVGAATGAIVGATGGTVYGLNRKNQDDTRAAQAYQACMAQRGF
jgi:hypothetical protein